ncbi:MAG: tetratricopeptide repeat protein, partial [Chitinophagaceae bacterium]
MDVYLKVSSDPAVTDVKRKLFTGKALKILQEQKSDSLNKERLFEVANNYFSLRDWEAFKKASNSALEKSIKDRDTLNIAKAFRYRAEYYRNIENTDSAFYYYLKAEKLYKKVDDKISLGKIYLKKGVLQFYRNDYFGADNSISQAYNLLKNSDDKETVYKAVSMTGIIANEMEDYPRALDKHEEALKLVKQYNLNGPQNQEATTLNNIGNVYQNLDKNQEAITNFKLALQNKNLLNETPDLYAILVDNLAYSKFKLRDYSQLPALFFKALKIRDSLNMSSGVVQSEIHLSEYFAAVGDTVNSQKYAYNAIFRAKTSKTPVDVMASLKQLSLVDHKNASKHTREYIKLNDSLQQAERLSKNNLNRI